MIPYAIIDVEFLDLVETLYPGWDVWTCTVTLEDGDTIDGRIQGDGVGSFDAESFEPEEEL
jgi:hypothetical protein